MPCVTASWLSVPNWPPGALVPVTVGLATGLAVARAATSTLWPPPCMLLSFLNALTAAAVLGPYFPSTPVLPTLYPSFARRCCIILTAGISSLG